MGWDDEKTQIEKTQRRFEVVDVVTIADSFDSMVVISPVNVLLQHTCKDPWLRTCLQSYQCCRAQARGGYLLKEPVTGQNIREKMSEWMN